jgi:hypothetical protein
MCADEQPLELDIICARLEALAQQVVFHPVKNFSSSDHTELFYTVLFSIVA